MKAIAVAKLDSLLVRNDFVVVRAVAKGKDPRGMPVGEISTQEIVSLSDSNRELIVKGQRDVHEALNWLGETQDETYAADGNSVRHTAARLIDRTL